MSNAFFKTFHRRKNEKSGTGEGSFTGRDQQTAEGLPDSGREVRHANIQICTKKLKYGTYVGKSYEKILRETGEWTYVKKFDEKVP